MTDQRQYIIIGGATKAATTSVYFYLAAHPQVCQSSMKETRFFLDTDYPVQSEFRYPDGLDSYNQFYAQCPDSQIVRMEATPDYLYSPGTPARIKQSLDSALLCFILRRPADRLLSWYKYATQRSIIPAEMPFDDYVRVQMSVLGDVPPETPQAMRALEQGSYVRYLQPYLDIFGEENVCLLLFEDVAQTPQNAMSVLAGMAGIDVGLYDGYDFAIHNQGKAVRNVGVHHKYISLRSKLRKRTHSHTRLHRSLKQIRRQVDKLYEPFNVKSTDAGSAISPETMTLLDDFYAESIQTLGALIDRDLSSWMETVQAT